MTTPPLPACAEVPPTVLASASSSPAEPATTNGDVSSNKKRFIGEVTHGEDGEISVTFRGAQEAAEAAVTIHQSAPPAKKAANGDTMTSKYTLDELSDYADAVSFKIDTLVDRLNAMEARNKKESLTLNRLRATFIETLSETAALIAKQCIADADATHL